MQTRSAKTISLWLLITMVILLIVSISRIMTPAPSGEIYTYQRLIHDIRAGVVDGLTIQNDADVSNIGQVTVNLANNVTHNVYIPDMNIFMTIVHENMDSNRITFVDTTPPSRPGWFMQILPFLLISAVFMIILFVVMGQAQGGGGGRAMNFGKSRARMTLQDTRKVTFEQVAGLDEEKEEMAEIVDFLKNPQKYQDIGARIPRGILLVGPPGTGKTYLARAVAGEADVPFYSISGSDFVEMFVGVGASRVRDLFEQAKRNPASIVIIDEIDAVGRKRGAGLGGGHDEREQTLNQLLVEMDGFGINEGVIVLAATNRPDILDPALLRPGRFDRRITVNPPDVKGREMVLRVHSEGKILADDVNLKTVAQTTSGMTPADLENLMNEAALLAARDNKTAIDMESIKKAFIKVGIGTEKKSRVITEKDRKVTAYHEAGHAVVNEVLPDLDPSYMVSIIPTGRAGGYTMSLPGEEKTMVTKGYFMQMITSLLGGRAAEKTVLDDITTGASNDIERATAIARNMVVKFGMSDVLGPVQFGDDNQEVFLGNQFSHVKNYSEHISEQIDTEIKRIVEEGYQLALRIMEEHKEVLTKIVHLLMEKERITGDEIRAQFPEGVLIPKERDAALLTDGAIL